MTLNLTTNIRGVPHAPSGCSVWRLKLNADTPALNRMVPYVPYYRPFESSEIRSVLGKIAGVESVTFPAFGEIDLHVRNDADSCAIKAALELAATGAQPAFVRAA